uniref:Sushi domain-containing protein n=1 Tax=Strix occidentalis caurina TaxID=311401 RepID=A0A8D0F6Y0_STROC
MELTPAFESWIFRIFFLALSVSLICLSFSFAEVTCPPPPGIANGNHSGQPSDSHLPGSAVQYSCRDGYSLIGNASISCTAEGTWSRPRPRCEAPNQTLCLPPPGIANGEHSRPLSDTFAVGALVHYRCKHGFSLIGNKSVRCTAHGVWSHPLPRCEGVFVLFSLNLLNFLKCVKPSVSYSCNPGYSLVGNALISCTASGTWSQPPPQCKGVFVLSLKQSHRKILPAIPHSRAFEASLVTIMCDSKNKYLKKDVKQRVIVTC